MGQLGSGGPRLGAVKVNSSCAFFCAEITNLGSEGRLGAGSAMRSNSQSNQATVLLANGRQTWGSEGRPGAGRATRSAARAAGCPARSSCASDCRLVAPAANDNEGRSFEEFSNIFDKFLKIVGAFIGGGQPNAWELCE